MQPVVVIGAITRGRPEMFARLLKSFSQMVRPEGVTVTFIFAENADSISIDEPVAQLGAATGCQCETLAEPRLGIPMARNRVLTRSLEIGADYLAFVDDDEWVQTDWLVKILNGFLESGTQLATGPVRPVYEDDLPLSVLERRLLAGIVAWADRTWSKNRRNIARDESFRIGAATNNWICDLAFLRKTGLRFDECIGLGGGSDTAFWRELVELGGRNTWVEDAIVFEEIPRSRLSIRYQFSRGRDQAMAEWRRRNEGNGLRSALRSLPLMTRCFIVGSIRVCIGFVLPGRSLLFGLRDVGKAVGRAKAVNGVVSSHYSKIHGG